MNASSDSDNAVVVEPPEAAQAAVIWLHGLGADGHDFEPIVPELGAAITRRVRFVFPHAPPQRVTINGGAVMRAWYDIRASDLTRVPDEAGISASSEILKGYINQQLEQGLAAERIVLAGFSQGGVIALRTGLLYPRRLAGVLALSTYLVLPEQCTEPSTQIPVFYAHGVQDPLIPLSVAQASRDHLSALGVKLTWKTYAMPHAVCGEEIRDIASWLSEILY